jgi:hypothetical protein
MKKSLLLVLLLWAAGVGSASGQQDAGPYVTGQSSGDAFPVASKGKVAPILVSATDYPGVIRAARDLQHDLEKVTGILPELKVLEGTVEEGGAGVEAAILIGTLGNSPLIDRITEREKQWVSGLDGKWESSLTRVTDAPLPGIRQALVIAGSDKRGTIYGIYELSSQAGVSPWYFWADVPPPHREELFVTRGDHHLGEPGVKYRGIFINDEAPALAGWAEERFGGFNHRFYSQVFELILRMKGNYLWPAMWGRAFYDDDPLNGPLADEYGIVIGTTHHEPLMRAHVEWSRYGEGPWDYDKNPARLRAFWREGIKRMDSWESIVSVGMRGDGDEPMTQGTAIELLERIVADQRLIIADVTGKPAEETPQLWALYKEVQDYFDAGMRVPDDVTLLLCDDNWGNLRMLPGLDEPVRKGGYGIYYHFDYVGGPRNYKWLNTNQIERVWEQMHLAWAHGVDRIWIVNVGDIKPMELPTQFFLDMAWDPGSWEPEDLPGYYLQWSRQQFGEEPAAAIAPILADYTRFNSRRKPELLSPATYSLDHDREAERVVSDYRALEAKALEVRKQIPAPWLDAYDQLVRFPVSACANLNDLYVTAALNKRYAAQGRAATHNAAQKVRELFETDSLLTEQYHHEIADGKWNHMMAQTHIGYTNWQQPDQNNMPEVQEISLPGEPLMGVSIEGSDRSWPGTGERAELPVADPVNRQAYYVEIFNKGSVPFRCSVVPAVEWLVPDRRTLDVDLQERISLEVAWEKVPEGMQEVPVLIEGPGGQQVTVTARVDNRPVSREEYAGGAFFPDNGVVSMEAASYRRAMDDGQVQWREVPNLGRTLSAMITLPVTALPDSLQPGSPCLEYRFACRDTGQYMVYSYLSPTLDFLRKGGLEFAISLDEEAPVVVNMHQPDRPYLWNRWVSDNIIVKSTPQHITRPGIHTLRFWRRDAGVVLQKIVVAPRDQKVEGYLGPPECRSITP